MRSDAGADAVRTIAPIANARGDVQLPGSKSISNRALLLAALANGTTRLTGLLDADDTRVMIDALRALGVSVAQGALATEVTGCGGRFARREAQLNLGNAGTAMRPLAAVLAFSGGRYVLDGVARMRERPIGDLVDALLEAGARVSYLGKAGYPPLLIEPPAAGDARVASIGVRGSVSSQFLTGLLIAAPLVAPPDGVRLRVEGELISRPYVDLTLGMMRAFGASAGAQGAGFVVGPGAYRSPGTYAIEGDASAASYFLALGAVAGGPVRVRGVGRSSLQGDLAFTDVLERMGACIAMGEDWIECSAPPGASADLPLQGIEFDATAIPDAAMTAAVLALFARGCMRLKGIGSWRVKETDRIHAMATEIAKLGAVVRAGPDWLEVEAPAHPREAWIDTYDDHRMAMCLSLAAARGVPVHIRDPQCVRKTYPSYFDELARLCASPQA